MALHAGLLLERDQELERIRRHLRRAAEGRGGALVVEGPPGMGKTALLMAAREAAQSDGVRVLRARGAELEREFGFGVVRQLVEPLLAQAPDAERVALLEGPAGLAARLLAVGGEGDAGDLLVGVQLAAVAAVAVAAVVVWLLRSCAC